MANCMTCRHNDKRASYCPLKRAHTDLGYVLNCVAWAETDEHKMKRLMDDNAQLRELASKCMDALRGNGISLDEYEELEGIAYSLRVDA